MDVAELLLDLYGRVDDEVRGAVEGLSADHLAWTPAPGTNSIGWLVWHLTRVEDVHVAELVDERQVWETGSWADGFGRPADPDDTGYGHTAEEVAGLRAAGPDALIGYYTAVRERTRRYLAGLAADELDRVVDPRWDPPVRLGVRLISVVDDEIQHAGQAAYVRGLLPPA